MEHNHCGTPDCCDECETNEQENTMSIKELMEEIEKLKARVAELEKQSKEDNSLYYAILSYYLYRWFL